MQCCILMKKSIYYLNVENLYPTSSKIVSRWLSVSAIKRKNYRRKNYNDQPCSCPRDWDSISIIGTQLKTPSTPLRWSQYYRVEKFKRISLLGLIMPRDVSYKNISLLFFFQSGVGRWRTIGAQLAYRYPSKDMQTPPQTSLLISALWLMGVLYILWEK